MMSSQIIEILNRDEKAKEIKRTFNQAVQKHGQDLTQEELDQTYQFMMMLCIKQNGEAMDIMAEACYEELRSQ